MPPKVHLRFYKVYEITLYLQYSIAGGLPWVLQYCSSQFAGFYRMANCACASQLCRKFQTKRNSCRVPGPARRRPLLALCRSTGFSKLALRMCILGPSSVQRYLSELPHLYPKSQRSLFSCIINTCAPQPGINFVQDPPDVNHGGCDHATHRDCPGEVDGERTQSSMSIKMRMLMVNQKTAARAMPRRMCQNVGIVNG